MVWNQADHHQQYGLESSRRPPAIWFEIKQTTTSNMVWNQADHQQQYGLESSRPPPAIWFGIKQTATGKMFASNYSRPEIQS
jgi:hypothetical protein